MKPALGKGLDALLPRTGTEAVELDVERITPSPGQPRRRFDEEALKGLAASVGQKGILQPIIVTSNGDGSFSVVAGERRLRAARLAGLARVPAIIKKVPPQDSAEIALIENIQREDLNPIEIAHALERLQREFGLTQEGLSERLGKERASIANHLRLLRLPDEVKEMVARGVLSMGHAKAVLSLETKQEQAEAAKKIVTGRLSVRQAEKLVKGLLVGGKQKAALLRAKRALRKDPNIHSLEQRLIESLGTKVRITGKGKKGKIEIEYYSLEQLQGLLEKML